MKRVTRELINTRLFAILFAITFIASFFMCLNAYADSNVFKISDVTITDKSSTVTGSVTDIDKNEVENNFKFHKVGDYIVYKITLQNIKGNELTILSITDNNTNPYIVYDYDKHENEKIADGKSIAFVVKATYKNEVTDISNRNQSNHVKFTINFQDEGKQESSDIIINPKTGDKINISIAMLIISAIGMLLCFIFEKRKKLSKTLIVIGLLFVPFIIKAASYVYNIELISEYGLYDKEVVTYVIDGVEKTKVVPYNDNMPIITAPSKTGYTFKEWKTSDGNVFDFSTPITDDIKITAIYDADEYDITYDYKGGNASNPSKYTIESNITLNAPTKNGYTFTGYTGTDLTEPTKNVTISNKTGNRNYVANYEVTTNRVNYSGITNEYASSIGNPLTYTIEDTDIPLVNPTKEGYDFIGWTGSNGNTPQMSAFIPSGSYGDKTYTANFSIKSYTLDVDPNGGSFENSTGITPKTNEYNSVIVLSEPIKEGYTFTGWTLTGSGTLSGNSYTYGAGNGTITANYTITNYEIKYHGLTDAEETALGNPDTYNINSVTITLHNPSNRVDGDGDVYEVFTGWKYGDSTSITATIPTGSTGKKEFTANFVHVDPDTYTIAYDLHDGVLSEANPLTYTIKTPTFTLSNPTKEGYTFAGWTGTDLSTPTMTVTIYNRSTGDRSYEATYTTIDYNITYTGIEGAIISPSNPTTYTIETNTFNLNNPSKTGYNFTGWTGSNGSNPESSVSISKGSTGDKNYTANYSLIDYNITYTGIEGATISPSNPTTYTIETGTIVLTNPTKEGYTFTGWSGTGLTGNDNLSVTIPTNSTGDRSYEAHFSLAGYNITYETHGGTVSGTNPTSYNAETGAITLINPTKDGYNFTGWSGTGLTGNNNMNVTIPAGSTGDRSYEAHYGIINYNLTYSSIDGATINPSNPTSYNVESSVIELTNPTKTGYDFTGWSGTGLTGNDNLSVTIPTGSTGDRSYVAHFSLTDYNITYETHGGIASGNPTTYNIESGAITLINPTKDGYNFTGWSGTDLTGNNNMNVTIPAVSTGDRSYEAHYSIIDYNITYDNAGGTVSGTNPTTYNVETGVIVLINPSKTGYTFTGWSGTDLTGNDNLSVTIPSGATGDRSYVAHFSLAGYNITYETHGGTVSGTNPTSYNAETGAITLINPSKTGYNFTGWSGTDLTGNDNLNVVIPSGATGDRSYEAHYSIIDYNITYDNAGGTVTGTNPTTYNVETGVIVLINPSKTGYTFTGWSGTGLTGNDNLSVTIPSGATGDRSYVAHFALIQYDIEYSGITPAEAIALGNPIQYNIESNTFTLVNPTKVGYNFDGWTGSNGSNPEFTVTIDHGTTGDLNYTANFTIIDYDIDYELNGGSVSGTNPTTYNIESGAITLINPSKTGYTFTGWSGTDLTGNDNMSVTIPANSIGDREFEAHFTANKYYVEFDKNSNEAVGTMSNQEFTYDVSGQLANNAYTRNWYIFNGWNTDPAGNGTPYTNMANVSNLATSGTITLYAQWVEDLVTVTLDVNGGNSLNPIVIRRNTQVGTLPTPTNNDSHKIFVGWFINLSDVTPLDGTYAPSADITIIAKWRNDTDVCEMNGSYYATVQDAVNAAPASETNNPADAPQVTINLLMDINMTKSQNYVLDMFDDKDLRDNVDYKNSMKNIILDMHGYGFYQPSGSGTNNYIVRTKGILEMKNGIVEGYSRKGAVEADGSKSRFTINNMHIEAKNQRQAAYNDGGTMYITGGSVLIAAAPTDSNNPRGTVQTLNGGTTYILSAQITATASTGYAVSGGGGSLSTNGERSITIIGTKDGVYDTSNIIIQGKQNGIFVPSSAPNVSIKIYDGIIKSTSSPVISDENLIADTENNSTIVRDNDGTYNIVYYTITP